MKVSLENNIGEKYVPVQQIGTAMNANEKIELASEAEAICFFKIVKERLLNVNKWAEIASITISTFRLTDSAGNEVQRNANTRDYLKINIPGPATKIGDGYDWVVIEQIKEEKKNETELLTMTVRPASNPLNQDNHIAHFLTDQATSTFQVKRIRNVVYAEEKGRNEVPNINTGNTLDNIRNTCVGWAAKIGFSYPQWKSLVSGLLKTFD